MTKKSQLKFITCGSVDDGKSTLIGRMLHECSSIFSDQFFDLKNGKNDNQIDYSLLLDGLKAEREQGITIDVAYRYFATDNRSFIIADTPGHLQYTRNMVTAASNCDAALILVDARKGIVSQTKRHAFIVNLMGIKNIALIINKMDLTQYSQSLFEEIKNDFYDFANQIGIKDFTPIPISAKNGDNLTANSPNFDWYSGPNVLEYLEKIDLHYNESEENSFVMPVQYVNRPNLDFRGYCGTIIRGEVKLGDEICILPSAKTTKISKIVTFEKNLDKAVKYDAVTLCFEDEIDCSRGDVIVSSENRLQIADIFKAQIIWFSETALVPRRKVIMQIGTQIIGAYIEPPNFCWDFNNLNKIASKTFECNDIGEAEITTDKPIAFETYEKLRELGGFIIIDKVTNQTLGAGLIKYALRRANNIHWQKTNITREQRALQKSQKPAILWFTGLSGSGKSTIANLLETKLYEMGYHTFLLDGDNLRHGLCKDLGFTQDDRIENIRRASNVARLMSDAGLIVLGAFISPFEAERNLARSIANEGEFIEIYIEAPLEVVEARDPKGLYKKARKGELKNFTGIDSPYEIPTSPDLILNTQKYKAEHCVETLINYLKKNGFIN